MINNLLLGASNKMTAGDVGIVVLIGVGLVFLILLLLIGVVKLLQLLNKALNKWDEKMAVVRANKAEVKALKMSYENDKDEKINKIYLQLEKGEISKNEFKEQLAKAKNEYKAKKPEIDKAVNDLKAKQKGITQPSQVSEANTNAEVVTDAKLIAVISAAIAVVTEQEQAERKVKFKVRSIKQIK